MKRYKVKLFIYWLKKTFRIKIHDYTLNEGFYLPFKAMAGDWICLEAKGGHLSQYEVLEIQFIDPSQNIVKYANLALIGRIGVPKIKDCSLREFFEFYVAHETEYKRLKAKK